MITLDDAIVTLFAVIVLSGWVVAGVCVLVAVLEWHRGRNDF